MYKWTRHGNAAKSNCLYPQQMCQEERFHFCKLFSIYKKRIVFIKRLKVFKLIFLN